jgi:hypothetical protein
MANARYGRGMQPRRSLATAALLAAVLGLSACGGESATSGDAGTSSSSPSASGTASTASALVVVRTGGIAGVRDTVRLAADGTGRITSKSGQQRDCSPPVKDIDRLRAIDLAAVAATPTKAPQLADGFNYSVKSGSTTAQASEGDDDGRRAELVDAAAAVVASCQAG